MEKKRMQRWLGCLGTVVGLVLQGCGSDSKPTKPAPLPQEWAWVEHSQAAALLGVHGTAADDVWLTGADDGQGPLLFHWDGKAWRRQATGVRRALWWVDRT